MSLPHTRTQRRVRRTLRIALIWGIAGLLAALFERNILAGHGIPIAFSDLALGNLAEYFLVGLIAGGLYSFVLRDHLRKLPFIQAFPRAAAVIFLIVTCTHAALPVWMGQVEADAAGILGRLFSLRFLGQYLFWSLLMGATMLMVRYNDQYGVGGWGHLVGRYHKPREELRIFLFLDMRSSTAIAEELGHVRYFQLLNEVYADITDPVLDSGGEIYQYVGDEVSVSWLLRKGIKQQRCLRCFFAIQDRIKAKAAHYQQRYGHAPIFKAGLHYGPVTAGEVGLVKKQVIFSGDPVITAAHIQSVCNQFGVELLMSEEMLDQLRLPEHQYERRSVGEIPLKSRKRTVRLWTVDRKGTRPGGKTAGPSATAEAATSSTAAQ
ncbi:MAG: adenylate/guanylate cyclase domain-containing protein [Flavobacteriales bacterium]|nr:adenylate/guanylate cyclase domain-containing protein [Flavobacteriales bacterium]